MSDHDQQVSYGTRRLQAGPLEPYLDSYAAFRASRGYASSTIRCELWWLGGLGRWLASRDIRVDGLDEDTVAAFFEDQGHPDARPQFRIARRPAFRCLLEHLRSIGVIRTPETIAEDNPEDPLLRRYEEHLRQLRGLAPTTIKRYRAIAGQFLVERFSGRTIQPDSIGASDVSAFVLRQAKTMSPAAAKLVVTTLRSFLRFLLQQGEIGSNLAASVPSVPHWRLATIPRHLPAEQVERLLASCDRSLHAGRRDYAILLLLARLGLRSCEVLALELDDINWRKSELMIRGKGRVRDLVPLLEDVGEAIAAYVRGDRDRNSDSRRIFLRVTPPRRPLGGSCTVAMIVHRALLRVGLKPPTRGAHLLRHSLATGMLLRGASMSEIGEVLRHRSPASSEVYAKVDIGSLRSVAQPWPGKGGA